MGTIGRHYAKWRSTEPLIQHPANPKLRRLLTPTEHARVKTIPEALIEGLSATTAHQCLGQSVLHCAFIAVGRALGRAIGAFSEGLPVATTSPLPRQPVDPPRDGLQLAMFA